MELLNKNLFRMMWEQSNALSHLLKKMQHETYPSKGIHEFVLQLSNVNERFKVISSEQAATQTFTQKQINYYNQLFQRFIDVVGNVSHATTTDHPLEVMIPVREIVETVSGNPEFITDPSWKITYSIGECWSSLAKHLVSSRVATVDIKQRIRVVFPTLYKDNVLLGCIMGHELGHYFDLHHFCPERDQHGLNISESLLSQLLGHDNLSKLVDFLTISDSYRSVSTPELMIMIVKGILSGPQFFLKNWLRELVADIAGILLYGPSSYFAWEQLFMLSYISPGTTTLVDRFSHTHPRNLTRSLVKKATLDKLGYSDKFPEEISQVIRSWHDGWEKANVELVTNRLISEEFCNVPVTFQVNNHTLQLIEEILLDQLDFIIQTVQELIPADIHYQSDKITSTVTPLAEKLSNVIPPNELNNQPVDSISILNAGWFAYLSGETIMNRLSLPDNEQGKSELRTLLNNLVRKALVSANIHRRWEHVSAVGRTD